MSHIKQKCTYTEISPPSISIPPPTVVAAVVTVAVGNVLAVYVDSVTSLADVVGEAEEAEVWSVLPLGIGDVAVLLTGSSVGVLAAVEVDSVEVDTVLEVVDAVGVGEEPVDEDSVEYVAAVAAIVGVFSCLQRASRTQGGHMCGERHRSAVFDIES